MNEIIVVGDFVNMNITCVAVGEFGYQFKSLAIETIGE